MPEVTEEVYHLPGHKLAWHSCWGLRAERVPQGSCWGLSQHKAPGETTGVSLMPQPVEKTSFQSSGRREVARFWGANAGVGWDSP